MGDNLDRFVNIAFSLIVTETALLLVLVFALRFKIINHATFLLLVLMIVYFMGLQTYKYLQHYDHLKKHFDQPAKNHIEVGG